MSDYMLTITFAPKYGEADVDRLMEVLLDRSENLGPVVDIDASGALSVTVGFEAQEDFEAMIATHVGAIGAAMEGADVAAHELVDAHVSRVDTREPELQPA
jgi:hypothetical protein